MEYNFLRSVYGYIQHFRELPIPVLLADAEFLVHWSNQKTKSVYPRLTEEQGLKNLLAEFDLDQLTQQLASGALTLQNVFPLSTDTLSLSSFSTEEGATGIIAMVCGSEIIPGASGATESSQVVGALGGSIRQSVSSLFSSLDILSDKADILNAGWISQHLKALSLNGYQVLRIASNLSEFADLQSGRLSGLPEPVCLTQWLQDISNPLSAIGDDAGIPICFDLSPEPAYVSLQLPRFEIAFYNILHNSLLFTRPENHIEIKADSDSNNNFFISIQDHGVGISPEYLQKEIFRPYFSYSPKSGGPDGLGLGLPIASSIIESFGGAISLDSKTGCGTKVVIQLPLQGFSAELPLAQGTDTFSLLDRFSSLYVGLLGATAQD